MPLHPVYDRRLKDGRTLGALVLRPLDRANVSPLVVDAGARNRLFLLPRIYAERATLIGFEPNRVEYEKLLAGATDGELMLLAQGIARTRFKAERYFPFALWDRAEERDLYITRGAGACTLMGPTTSVARNLYFRHPKSDARRRGTLHDVQTEVVGTQKVQCERLDQLVGREEVVDFLKIDVEGAELRVLQGAESLLRERRVLFIRAEFQLVPYYAEHPLLCEQHRLLSEHGFRLLDLEFAHPRYRRGPTDLPDRSDRGLLLAGDALYSLDPDHLDLSPLMRQRIAAVAFAFELTGYGLSLIQEASLLTPQEIADVAAALAQPPARSIRRKLLDTWVAVPYKTREALLWVRARMNALRPN
jgi:FkbM family methyltransferase